jgi:hypothetical protein
MADYGINPKTGKKEQIHEYYPQTRQQNQDHDCLFCVNAATCERHRGMFFVNDKREPCKIYVCRSDIQIAAVRKKDEEEAARRAAIKATTKPVPRPPEAPKDCLHCKYLQDVFYCNTRRAGPRQGEGSVCDLYMEVVSRPEGEAINCIYCLTNFNCERGKVMRNKLCEKYVEFVPENAETASA